MLVGTGGCGGVGGAATAPTAVVTWRREFKDTFLLWRVCSLEEGSIASI